MASPSALPRALPAWPVSAVVSLRGGPGRPSSPVASARSSRERPRRPRRQEGAPQRPRPLCGCVPSGRGGRGLGGPLPAVPVPAHRLFPACPVLSSESRTGRVSSPLAPSSGLRTLPSLRVELFSRLAPCGARVLY